MTSVSNLTREMANFLTYEWYFIGDRGLQSCHNSKTISLFCLVRVSSDINNSGVRNLRVFTLVYSYSNHYANQYI